MENEVDTYASPKINVNKGGSIDLLIPKNDDCASHYIRVNHVTMTLIQHDSGHVTIGVHNMKKDGLQDDNTYNFDKVVLYGTDAKVSKNTNKLGNTHITITD